MKIITEMTFIEEINDQSLLEEISLKCQFSEIRKLAVKKLTDQRVLAKVALKDEDDRVIFAAVRKITDQAILTEYSFFRRILLDC